MNYVGKGRPGELPRKLTWARRSGSQTGGFVYPGEGAVVKEAFSEEVALE